MPLTVSFAFLRNFTYWLRVVSLGLIVGLSIQFVQAWTAPVSAPPAGNVAGPITTGAGTQIKNGGLWLNGGLRVDGSVVLPTGAGIGKVLTSDAIGNASWGTGTGSSGGGSPLKLDAQFTSGAFSFAKPNGATKAHVQLQGGGAAGRNSTGGNYGGAGGGAGGYAEKIIDVSSVNSLSGSIGAGGAASGGAGGASTLTGYLNASGGSGGAGGSATGGDLNFAGGSGAGGQGGYMGGGGGNAYFGGGGPAYGPNAGTSPAGIRGGGGSGAGSFTPAVGGAGGTGFVVVYWY
ncbi:MAG: hypothetical protein A2878_01655 [Candidatus Moranbacteria bacterium RIFCSPHIGHO2_01_FULL_54_31]|nr:MAG: hypothetical protein A2878_01655 [Candidatus Moranbacteria bacterium RIFCSPHIGHO2_01_FULL_54_31]